MANKKTRESSAAAPGADSEAIQRPKTKEEALRWVRDYTGVRIADAPVCRHHHTPAFYFWELLQRPPLALVLGPRGGGKSFLSALDTHYTSRWNPKHGTKILGGSRAQSEQIYRALSEVVYGGNGEIGSDEDAIAKLTKSEARYVNGSEVSILAASSTSVRGPHVPSLKLDEIDELKPELRDAAMGMCMNRSNSGASVLMTSTWHRQNGPMSELIQRADAGGIKFFKFCSFEILEQCSPERSGRWVGGEAGYENCPQCVLKTWCHAERDANGNQMLAKRSNGHYAIDSLIQKVQSVSARTFESDYLCKGPRSESLWFPTFDRDLNVDELAEYDRHLQVHLAVDTGVFTGAVFFQIAEVPTRTGTTEEIRVFADYLAENVPAEQNAGKIRKIAEELSRGMINHASTDPAGGARNASGPTVISEYERGGLKLKHWPHGSVSDGLALLESFINPADGETRLKIHPRCKPTLIAFQNYRRARRGGQLMDYPEDPQHPFEDLIDALRGGLRNHFPEGRRPQSKLRRVNACEVF